MPLKVFVSGGIRELAEERNLARKTIEDLRLVPIMFELRPPSTQDAGESYLEGVRFCDLYLGIVGGEGSPETLQEFQEAVKLDRKCLIFVKKIGERPPEAAELLEQAGKFKHTEYSSPKELSLQLREALLDFVAEETLRQLEARGKVLKDFVQTYLEDYVRPVLDEVKDIEDRIDKKRLGELPTTAWNTVSRSVLFGADPQLDQRIAEFYSKVRKLNIELLKTGIEDHRRIVASIMQETFLENAQPLNEYAAIERILTENLEFFLTSGDAYSEIAKPLLDRLDGPVKSIPREHWKIPYVSALWLINKTSQRTLMSHHLEENKILKGVSGGVKYFDAFGTIYPEAKLVREVLQRVYQKKIQAQ
jgi:hypothetical protein